MDQAGVSSGRLQCHIKASADLDTEFASLYLPECWAADGICETKESLELLVTPVIMGCAWTIKDSFLTKRALTNLKEAAKVANRVIIILYTVPRIVVLPGNSSTTLPVQGLLLWRAVPVDETGDHGHESPS